tara:strand:- start:174 stop:566 length:393 start_codon:yes stop_codon:yes gene_type:complete
MADLLVSLSSPHGSLVFTESAANATIVQNVFNKVAATVYYAKLDNTSNTSEDVYLKLWPDTAADAQNVTVGTTNPIFVMKAAAGKVVEMYMPNGFSAPASNYAHIAVTTEAGVAGTTAPTGTVAVTLIGA